MENFFLCKECDATDCTTNPSAGGTRKQSATVPLGQKVPGYLLHREISSTQERQEIFVKNGSLISHLWHSLVRWLDDFLKEPTPQCMALSTGPGPNLPPCGIRYLWIFQYSLYIIPMVVGFIPHSDGFCPAWQPWRSSSSWIPSPAYLKKPDPRSPGSVQPPVIRGRILR